MEGLFKVKYDRFFELLDYNSLPGPERDILFQGKTYNPALHCICRLPIQINPFQTHRKSMRFIRRKGYENATRALVWARLETPGFLLLGILPNSTSVDDSQESKFSEEAILELNLPLVGKLQLTGKAEQPFRRHQRSIIAARTSSEAQWAFEKAYLQDNLGFNLIFLFEKQGAAEPLQVRIKLSFLDDGRDLYSPEAKLVSLPG